LSHGAGGLNAGSSVVGGLMLAGGIVGLLINMAINHNVDEPTAAPPALQQYARPSDEITLMPAAALDRCTVAIRDWLRESDAERKTALYEALSPTCHAQITRLEGGR
jgi:hypothetical protein